MHIDSIRSRRRSTLKIDPFGDLGAARDSNKAKTFVRRSKSNERAPFKYYKYIFMLLTFPAKTGKILGEIDNKPQSRSPQPEFDIVHYEKATGVITIFKFVLRPPNPM